MLYAFIAQFDNLRYNELNYMKNKLKIIVILGPTASGKSDLAIKMAKKFNGEIISADSRQIYKGMDIASGKIEPDRPGEIPTKFTRSKFTSGSHQFISSGILHHLLDITMPNKVITVSQWQKMAEKAIKEILSDRKLPIICGGTGLYISALINNANFPAVKPDWKLRKKLGNYSAKKLFAMLKKIDKERAKNIDQNNPARLIRAIEIAKKFGSVPKIKTSCELRAMSYEFLQIGIEIPREELYKKINKRVDQMVKKGLFQEAKKLLKEYKTTPARIATRSKLRLRSVAGGLPSMSGIGYQEIEKFLNKELTKEEAIEQIKNNTRHYAKRQMTWFQKDKRIHWIKNQRETEKLIKKFLK